MSQDLRALADARLSAALEERQLADSRKAYRSCLRTLREANPELYERASQHYQARVLPLLAGAEDPVDAWVEYGRFLAELLSPGRLVAVDGSGRARPFTPPATAETLVLHVPEDRAVPAMALSTPRQPSPAQQATYDLLVLGRDSLGA